MLNYKFWIIVFGKGEIVQKIDLIAKYYPMSLKVSNDNKCNILHYVYYFFNITAIKTILKILLNVFWAFIISIAYPVIINCTKWVYEKLTNRAIPITETVKELKKEIEGLKKKTTEAENSKKGFESKYNTLAINVLSNLPKSLNNKDFLELCSKIEIYIYILKKIWYDRKPSEYLMNLKQILFLLYNNQSFNNDIFCYIINILGFSNYLSFIANIGRAHDAKELDLYKPIHNILIGLERLDFQNLFLQEIKDFAGELERSIIKSEDIKSLIFHITAHIYKTLNNVNKERYPFAYNKNPKSGLRNYLAFFKRKKKIPFFLLVLLELWGTLLIWVNISTFKGGLCLQRLYIQK